MSFSREGDTLSGRLSKLKSFHQNEAYVWDIGCDHGLLGSSFKDNQEVMEIHLVDPAEAVIRNLKDSYISVPKIKIHHSTGQEIKIQNPGSNLVFIAGMGGMEIKSILEILLPQLNSSSQIVISPHRKILELREALSQWDLSLISETVIEEDAQFYQILSMRPGSGRRVSLYGYDLWQTPTGRRYREKDLLHFGQHRDEASKAYIRYLRDL